MLLGSSIRHACCLLLALIGVSTTSGAQPRVETRERKDEIATDRPDFTEASSTVGKGRQQLESGYTFSRNRNIGIVRSHTYPELLLRVGVISDAIELRVGQSFVRTTAEGAGGDPTVSQGAEDLYTGVKFALRAQRRLWPETALVLQSTVPTGAASLTAGRMMPGVNLLYGWELRRSAVSLGGSTQLNSALNDERRCYPDFAQALTVGWDFATAVGAYVEAYAFVPLRAVGASVARTRYVNSGFRIKSGKNVQYDVRVGRGLTAASDDYFVGLGVSVRR